MLTTLFLVALGGGIGAVLRYGVGLVAPFPFGTLAVNILGSFLMGLAFVALTERGLERLTPFLMIGVFGGFTTFSAFSLDVFKLVDADRFVMAGGYILASVLLSVAALFLAIGLMRGLG
jgi:CrcB protein